jgi:transcription elongation factor GreA
MKKAVRPLPPQIRFTKEGFEKLKKEHEELLKQRPPAVAELKKAREMGDLSENGYYKASKQKLNFIDGQLRRITHALKYASIIESVGVGIVEIGRTVTLSDGTNEKIYEIVGDWEADPMNGKISLLSPIGKAIADKKVGDEITIEIPAGKKSYTITALK